MKSHCYIKLITCCVKLPIFIDLPKAIKLFLNLNFNFYIFLQCNSQLATNLYIQFNLYNFFNLQNTLTALGALC